MSNKESASNGLLKILETFLYKILIPLQNKVAVGLKRKERLL
jgi:hypothetical protein